MSIALYLFGYELELLCRRESSTAGYGAELVCMLGPVAIFHWRDQ